MRQIFLSIVGLSALILAGCARFPDDMTDPNVPSRTLLSEVTVLGTIDPNAYYFLALDTDEDPATGPIPVVTGPELGTGWGIISGTGPDDPLREPPFYVLYNSGRFEQFLNGQPIGPPFRGEVTQGDRGLLVEIDQNVLGTPIPANVQLNWITMNNITIPPQGPIIKEYDGFGPRGNDYLDSVNLNVAQIWNSGQAGLPDEEPADTTTDPDIDLIGWRVEVKIRQESVVP